MALSLSLSLSLFCHGRYPARFCGLRTGALPAPTVAELVLPWRGQERARGLIGAFPNHGTCVNLGEDADFPDFREVVAALFVLLHKYSHQEDLALGLLKVQAKAAWEQQGNYCQTLHLPRCAKAGLARSTRTVRVTEAPLTAVRCRGWIPQSRLEGFLLFLRGLKGPKPKAVRAFCAASLSRRSLQERPMPLPPKPPKPNSPRRDGPMPRAMPVPCCAEFGGHGWGRRRSGRCSPCELSRAALLCPGPRGSEDSASVGTAPAGAAVQRVLCTYGTCNTGRVS